jgi:acyl dehydratase
MMVIPLDRSAVKEPTWGNIVVGEAFGPLDVIITDHIVKSYVYAIDDYHPWYLQDSPLGGRIAPTTLLTRALLDMLYLEYDAIRLRALHVRQELELLRPVKMGQRVTLHARVTDKFLKRGEPYVVLAAQASDEHGKTLIRTKQTEIFRSDVGPIVGRRSATSKDPVVNGAISVGAPMAERAGHNAEIGSMIPSISKKITLEQMFVFFRLVCLTYTLTALSRRKADFLHRLRRVSCRRATFRSCLRISSALIG